MSGIRLRVTDVGDSQSDAQGVSVRVLDAVRGWVTMEVPAGVSTALATRLVDAEITYEGATDEAPGTPTMRAVGAMLITKEWSNWSDLSGPKNRAMSKAHRARLEASLEGTRAALVAVMDAEGEGGDVDDFLEELSAWRVNHGHSRWAYTRTLGGYRQAP